MIILDGKKLRDKIINDLKNQVKKLKKKPGLAVVLVGNNPASKIYVDNKVKACEKIGFYSEKIILPENTSKEKLFLVIDKLNNNPNIHGILIQYPLPLTLNQYQEEVNNFINPLKDVDCFHPLNLGKFFISKSNEENIFYPCTAKGIIRLLKFYQIPILGKKAVVCGRSNLVGKPLALMLCNEHATISVVHSKTKNLKEITKTADIIVVAVGKANFLKKDMVKKGTIVIDVGINRLNGKIVGDVCFEEIRDLTSAITPVPGGIGPMTIASLMENVMIAYKKQLNQ